MKWKKLLKERLLTRDASRNVDFAPMYILRKMCENDSRPRCSCSNTSGNYFVTCNVLIVIFWEKETSRLKLTKIYEGPDCKFSEFERYEGIFNLTS